MVSLTVCDAFSHIILSLIAEPIKEKQRTNPKHSGESEAACVARLLSIFIEDPYERQTLSFRNVIVDEAHFLKNLVSYWGIGCALLGVNAERMVPLTGTPYNNGNQDLASLMAFIDPTHVAAQKDWWDKATSKRWGPAVAEAISDWREDYMVLRKKDVVLIDKLPPKIIKTMVVMPYMIELFLYEQDEDMFLKVLERFRKTLEDASPQAKRRLNKIFSYAMARLANMKKDLIHAMLSFGREVSIQFSPSRAHLLHKCEKSKQCVCCKAFNQSNKEKVKTEEGEDSKPVTGGRREDAKHASGVRRRARTDWNMDLDDSDTEDDDEAEEVLDEDDDASSKGEIVLLPGDLCDWSDGPCRHFAHEECLEVMRQDGGTCPRCGEMKSRLHLLQTMMSLDESSENQQTDEIGVSHRTYCKNITVSPKIPSGFKASAKVSLCLIFLLWSSFVPSKAVWYEIIYCTRIRLNGFFCGFARFPRTKR